MGVLLLADYEQLDEKHRQMEEYLSAEDGYWLDHDQWHIQSEAFRKSGLNAGKYKKVMLADFTGYRNESMKLETKYFLLYSMKNKLISPLSIYSNMTTVIKLIGTKLAICGDVESFDGLDVGDSELYDEDLTDNIRKRYLVVKRDLIRFMADFYDDKDEFEKDVWHASRILGVKISAAAKYLGTLL